MGSEATRNGDVGAGQATPAENGGHDSPRVLVVEDYFIVAELCRTHLESSGYTVLGPAPTVPKALEILEAEVPDFAILDVTLAGTLVTPVARRLAQLGRPFLFLTAASDLAVLPPEFREHPVLQKPVRQSVLTAAVEAALDR